jgi:hypothetical protein
LANFVGSVVGFLNVLVIRLRSILLAAALFFESEMVLYYQINKGGVDQRRLFGVELTIH